MKPLADFDPQLTKNFHIDEFACKDGTGVPWNLIANVKELAENLQVLRDELNAEDKAKNPKAPEVGISINSAFRNDSYNAKIGGAPESEHEDCQAADITRKGRTPNQIAEKIEQLIKSKKMKQGGIGIYKSWVHYDTRGTAARWNG